jgi:AcrR family transcriptional regulator
MAPPTRTPPAKWIEEGLRALGAGGPDAVRVEALARALGVTKGGFYNHFDDRPALLGEMLDTWERLGVDSVIEQVEAEGGDGRAKLWRLFKVTTSTGDLWRIELAIREWSRRERAVAKRLRRVDNRRLNYMRSLFREFCSDPDEVELRCLMSFSIFLGNRLLAADYPARERVELLERAQRRLIDT